MMQKRQTGTAGDSSGLDPDTGESYSDMTRPCPPRTDGGPLCVVSEGELPPPPLRLLLRNVSVAWLVLPEVRAW